MFLEKAIIYFVVNKITITHIYDVYAISSVGTHIRTETTQCNNKTRDVYELIKKNNVMG